jgi:hypothetical protein
MRRGGTIRKELQAAIVVAVPLAGIVVTPPAQAVEPQFSATRAEASYTSDSNVSRANGADALRDQILGVRVSKGFLLPVSATTRAVFQGFAGGEKFRTYTGLSHNFIGGQGDFQFRSSAEFGAATYSAFFRTQVEYFESDLRDGYRHVYGVSVLKPVTDRVQFLGAIQQNISDGKSVVFDTHSSSLRGNLDWSITRWDTAYLGAEYRSGESVSTVCRNCDPIRTLGLVNTATPNIIQDDAFTDTTRDAYRLKAKTWLATLGYNHAFSGGQSLDLSWRRVQSTGQNAVAPATASDLRYTVNQYSIAYLVRF